MPFIEMKIQGAWVHIPTRFEDGRGHFEEQFKLSMIEAELGRPFSVRHVNQSISNKGVVRGIHWTDSPDGQAGTLVHEALHIYLGFIGDQESGNFANAHCYEQFVLDMNWLDVPVAFVGSCP